MAFIYLISAEINHKPLYKIGYTEKDVQKRLKQLQTGNASTLCIIKTFEVKNYKSKIEKMLHRHFKHVKLVGEWFELSEDDVKNFETICIRYDNVLHLLKDNHFFKKI